MKFTANRVFIIVLSVFLSACAGTPQRHVVYQQGESTTADFDGEWVSNLVSAEYHPLDEKAPADINTPPATLLRMAGVERHAGAAAHADLIDMSAAPVPFLQEEHLPGGENRVFRISGDKGIVYGIASYSDSGPDRELMGCLLMSKGKGAIYEAYWEAKPDDWATVTLPAPVPLGEYHEGGINDKIADTKRRDFLKTMPGLENRVGNVQGVEDGMMIMRMREIPVPVSAKSDPAISYSSSGWMDHISEVTGDRGSVYVYQKVSVDKSQAFLEKCVIYPEPVAKVVRAWYLENRPAAKAPDGAKVSEAGASRSPLAALNASIHSEY